ncbi:uncharacterized protein B0T23DRAFT_368585 [Neurospora hispaniola]|uniref:Uncharacterized protein n=1 Tax=Neurospora hispaniola TaxID=588809 RepID=A0AAJ0IE88_9PEZI|nr:hypothetical protein B0T23DRAFT_368585 [Neurospora hispaniola]
MMNVLIVVFSSLQRADGSVNEPYVQLMVEVAASLNGKTPCHQESAARDRAIMETW